MIEHPRLRVWYRLAAILGWPVAILRRIVDSAEFCEWAAYLDLEPVGGGADDYRAAAMIAAVYNASGRVSRPLTPSDFLPTEFVVQKSDREISDGLRGWVASYNRSVSASGGERR